MNIRINSEGMMEIQRMPGTKFLAAICPYHIPKNGGVTVCGDWCVQFDDSQLEHDGTYIGFPSICSGGELRLCYGKRFSCGEKMRIEDLRDYPAYPIGG